MLRQLILVILLGTTGMTFRGHTLRLTSVSGSPESKQAVDMHWLGRIEKERVAVCLAGAARTFTDPLSIETIIAAFASFEGIGVDFYCWLTNDPRVGVERNSKNATYLSVANGEVRAAATRLTRSSKYGSFALNELNFQTSRTCNFGTHAEERFDQSNESLLLRQTQPMFKREKCFESVVLAEQEIQNELGANWQYRTIISLRPDIFFFSEIRKELLLTQVPIFPAPAHGCSRWRNGHVINDHLAFLPRGHAEKFFRMGKIHRTCVGNFSGSIAVCDRIRELFENSDVDLSSVIPYNLNRRGSDTPYSNHDEGMCDRVRFFHQNLELSADASSSPWVQQCTRFTAWFLSGDAVRETSRSSHDVRSFWRQNTAILSGEVMNPT